MKDHEINDYLAIHLMGWKKVIDPEFGHAIWENSENSSWKYEVLPTSGPELDHWEPSKYVEQAEIVIKYMRTEKGFRISLDDLSTPGQYDVEFISIEQEDDHAKYVGYGSNINMSKAVCLAAVDALLRLEGEPFGRFTTTVKK